MQPEIALAYRRYFPLLVRKCTRMLGDSHEAQDMAQEGFLRLLSAGLALDDSRAVTAWLYRTCTRLAIDRLRARTRQPHEPLAFDALSSACSPERSLVQASLWHELVQRVPEDELEAALLSYVDGLTQLEIGEVMGLHERSVRRLLARFDERSARLKARSE